VTNVSIVADILRTASLELPVHLSFLIFHEMARSGPQLCTLPFAVQRKTTSLWRSTTIVSISNIDWYCISDKQPPSLSSCWLHSKQKMGYGCV